MKKAIIAIALCISIASLTVAILSYKKTGYVDNVFIFENFNLKTELYNKLKSDRQIRENILDTLQRRLKSLEAEINASKDKAALIENYKIQQQSYDQKAQSFTGELKNLSEEADEKIWQKINTGILEFGKEKKYTYIFGANGQGSMMYAAEGEAITKEVLDYLNNSYEGKK